MAHLTNATAIRVGWVQDWWDFWYARKLDYTNFLYACLRIRHLLVYLYFTLIKDRALIIYSHFAIIILSKKVYLYIFFYYSSYELFYMEFFTDAMRGKRWRRRVLNRVKNRLKRAAKKTVKWINSAGIKRIGDRVEKNLSNCSPWQVARDRWEKRRLKWAARDKEEKRRLRLEKEKKKKFLKAVYPVIKKVDHGFFFAASWIDSVSQED